ncbi:hypothetical protein [Anaerobium acetethylicum]|uniref:Uncharacterized protein n=1 Tax=Anaerobium acetethylicum TaxID=1619234 RepID=A0A1D3TQ43_9FIRM|nr:hypothetical protein [Anaerobium acetethylicum]SCP95647.1 hypothetical protein SAMN05421730_100285 [Anaerobium acetethylicum]
MSDKEKKAAIDEQWDGNPEEVPNTVEHTNRSLGKDFKSEKKYKVGTNYRNDNQAHKDIG